MTTAPSSPAVDPNPTLSSPVELPHSSWRSHPTHSTSSDSSSGGQQPGPPPPVQPSRPILKPATLPPPTVTESPNVSIPPPQRLPGHLFTSTPIHPAWVRSQRQLPVLLQNSKRAKAVFLLQSHPLLPGNGHPYRSHIQPVIQE